MQIQGGNGVPLSLTHTPQKEGSERLRNEMNDKMVNTINKKNDNNQDLESTPQRRGEEDQSFDYMVIDDVVFPDEEEECNLNLSSHPPHIFTFNTDSIGSVSDE